MNPLAPLTEKSAKPPLHRKSRTVVCHLRVWMRAVPMVNNASPDLATVIQAKGKVAARVFLLAKIH